MTLKSINPATGETLETFEEWSGNQVDEQISKTREAFSEWRETSFAEREKLLMNMAKVIRNRAKKYAELITTEMGKPIIQAEMEVEKCADACEYFAKHGRRFLEDDEVELDRDRSYIRFTPLGVILGVMPWNFPFWQVFRWAIPTVLAGNVLLLKHSSNVPRCGFAAEEIFTDAGFPENVFKFLPIGSKKAEKIIGDPRIAGVSLTGSTEAGSLVAKAAGANLKKVVLELGGSDPFIVLEDVDLKDVVETAVKARMVNSGQSCIAAKRIIIMEEIFDDFVEKFTERVSKLVVGDPMDRETEVGPLAREDILELIEKQVEESVKKGAELLTGGKRLDRKGFFYQPTAITNVGKGIPVYDEETFGPVGVLIKAKNEEEAIRIANDTTYGLGGSVWTKNVKRGEEIAKKIEAGMVFVNEIVKSDPRLPFGGVKRSGFGRELSHYGIKEFVNIQTVYLRTP